jgi:hypothetical protein
MRAAMRRTPDTVVDDPVKLLQLVFTEMANMRESIERMIRDDQAQRRREWEDHKALHAAGQKLCDERMESVETLGRLATFVSSHPKAAAFVAGLALTAAGIAGGMLHA